MSNSAFVKTSVKTVKSDSWGKMGIIGKLSLNLPSGMKRLFLGGNIGLFTGVSLMGVVEALFWVYRIGRVFIQERIELYIKGV